MHARTHTRTHTHAHTHTHTHTHTTHTHARTHARTHTAKRSSAWLLDIQYCSILLKPQQEAVDMALTCISSIRVNAYPTSELESVKHRPTGGRGGGRLVDVDFDGRKAHAPLLQNFYGLNNASHRRESSSIPFAVVVFLKASVTAASFV